MATQYTPILQLALPVTGELNGTWGDVVNDNITSMVEEAIAGLATINTWTANSHTLTTANGTTDEARCAMLVAATGSGGTALSAAGEIICPARTKLFVLQNNAAYQVTLKTASGTGIAVAAGDTAFLFCDGTNVNACVTQIINGHITGNLTVDGNATVNGNTTLGNATSDTITATARIASDLNPSADNTYDLGTAGNSWRNLYIDSTATIASLVATTADINGGTIDATSIGATTPSTGVFTQVDITAQGDLRLQDASGGQYVAMQAPATVPASYTLTWPDTDGDAGQALVTDGSGVLSWSTAASGDVYGPASATDNAVSRFDGTTGKLIQNSVVTIGDTGDVAGIGAISMSGAITLSGGTANGVAYLNGSKILTTGSGLVFDGSNLGLGVTPSTGTGWTNQIEMISGGNVVSQGTNISLGQNYYYSSGYRYKANGPAAQYFIYNGIHTWFTAPSGTAGNLITFTDAMTLNASGYLGIGSTSPDSVLTAVNPASTAALRIGLNNTSYNYMDADNNIFRSGGGAERMRIDSSGNVGIGTSSPSYKLDVNGVANFASNIIHRVGGQPMFAQSLSGILSYLYTGSTAMVWRNQADSAEFMRLDSSGNLGLGVTPSAWQSGQTAFQFNSVAYVRGDSVTAALGNNNYYNGGWKYQVSSQYATRYEQNYGIHSWFTAPSGTAGDPITFTQAMTLDASGRLGIGQTSPAALLHLKGSSPAIFVEDTGANRALLGITASNTEVTFDATAYTSAVQAMVFKTGNSERMRIDSSGNVGIGTTAPAVKLDASGYAQDPSLTSNTGILRVQTATSNELQIGGYSTSPYSMWIQTKQSNNSGSNFPLSLNPLGGNVGIGTSSVTSGAKLQVTGSDDTYVFVKSDGAGDYSLSLGSGGTPLIARGAGAPLAFGTVTNNSVITGWTEQMRIDVNGSLLVGATTSPNAYTKLYVATASPNDETGNFLLENTSTSTGAACNAQLMVKSKYGSSQMMQWDSIGVRIGTRYTTNGGSGNVVFTSGSDVEAMRIDSSGNVGIGTSSPGVKFVVSQDQNAITYSDVANVSTGSSAAVDFRLITQNVANTGTTSVDFIKYKTGGFFINNYDTNAAVYTAFGVGASERMRIDSSGNLLVGTTSSQAPLTVEKSLAGANISYFGNSSATGYGITCFVNNDSSNTYRYFEGYSTSAAAQRIAIYTNGDVKNANGVFAAFSDIKLKQDIVDAGSQWEDIKALRVRKYRFKDKPNDPLQIGIIAQEVEQTSPGLVDESPDEIRDENGNIKFTGEATKSVKYSIVYMKAVKALQEAMERIEILEAEVAALKSN